MKYILDGRTPVPCEDVLEWALWYESADRVVEFTVMDLGVEVSTIFLAIDPQVGLGSGPPLLFETLCFTPDGMNGRDVLEDSPFARYATWEEAEWGHREAVEAIAERLRAARASLAAVSGAGSADPADSGSLPC